MCEKVHSTLPGRSLLALQRVYPSAMKIPKRLQPLVEDGLIEAVVRPLMSGKEATVLVVLSGGEARCAKVYKEASNRSFRQRADYQEGRSVRNSRRARAMAKRSKFGKTELEEAWQWDASPRPGALSRGWWLQS